MLWKDLVTCNFLYLLQVLGGIDESLYTGTIVYVPIYKEWYYEVILTDIDVGGTSLQMDCKEVSRSFIFVFIQNSCRRSWVFVTDECDNESGCLLAPKDIVRITPDGFC